MKKKFLLIGLFILVMVLGITLSYAFFSANITGVENASTLALDSGKLLIEYSENSGVISLSGIYPKEEAWATKTITLTGTNTTTLIMRYDLGLEVEENDFRNSYIKYDLTLIDENGNPIENLNSINGTPIENISLKNINGTGYKRFGIGSFNTANNEIHRYELKIYFKENGRKQNDAQKAKFKAKVVITDAGSINPNEKRAMFLNGEQVNSKMRGLANTNQSSLSYDTTITAIKESLIEPTSENKESKNIVSVNNSSYPIPIYMWYEDGTIYWWSEDKKAYLNSNSSRMFIRISSLSNIDGLANFDTSNVTNMSDMFNYTKISANALINWDVSNVTNMSAMFAHNSQIESLESLSKWDTSNVTDMFGMFISSSNITSLNGLSNWDVSNVTNMGSIFQSLNLITNLDQLINWDTSKVTNMASLFHRCSNITSLNGLSNWDVSNVTNMNSTFYESNNITSLEPLTNWDTSKVTNMGAMFLGLNNIPTLKPITNWDVSNVTNMYSMFSFLYKIKDLDPII